MIHTEAFLSYLFDFHLICSGDATEVSNLTVIQIVLNCIIVSSSYIHIFGFILGKAFYNFKTVVFVISKMEKKDCLTKPRIFDN